MNYVVESQDRYLYDCKWEIYDCGLRGYVFYDSNRYRDRNYGARDARDSFIGEFRTFVEAKAAVLRREPAPTPDKSKCKVQYIPAGDNNDFYPTPNKLAGQMFEMVDWFWQGVCKVETVLEPSAGKGDLIDALRSFAKKNARYQEQITVDCIENDHNLQYLLRGKGEHVIHDDFLTFDSRKRYDLILMNPPFSEGDKHLLKAIELQKGGGQIVCLLNAETLRNTYTNTRYVLAQKLQKLNAKIRYVKGAFTVAERKTGVEVAIVYINIPAETAPSDIYERMRKAHKVDFEDTNDCSTLASANPIENLLQTFKVEVDATLELFRQYNALVPYIQNDNHSYSSPIVTLHIGNNSNCGFVKNRDVNSYIRNVRTKYWNKLLDNKDLTRQFTSNILQSYRNQVNSLADYDFTEFNIMRVIDEMRAELNSGVEEAIMSLFEKLSAEHSYYPECTQNRHYFNGWKTNKAHKVGMKAIIPTYGCFASYSWEKGLNVHQCYTVLDDLEKSINYLNNGKTVDITDLSLSSVLDVANRRGQTKNILCKYFSVTFYKKGTCHIKFHPEVEPLIERLNIFAAQKRGWLPPSYGKVRYKDMEQEAQEVIDSFQGEAEYEKVMQNPERYLIDTYNITLLGA